jgi:hypothetical protein
MRNERPLFYRVAGLDLSSELDLPGLSRVDAPSTAPWQLVTHHLTEPETGSPYHVWRDGSGYAWLRFFREPAGRRLVFPGVLDVSIDDAARVAVIDPAPRTSAGRVQQLVSHYVLPLLQGLRHLVLHASAVEVDGRVLAFVGSTGTGKSTLAAALTARGARLVCDDAMVIIDGDVPRVLTWDGPLRLAPAAIEAVIGGAAESYRVIGDGATPKRAVPVPAADDAALPLDTIYLLARGKRAGRIARVSPSEAVRCLTQAAFDMTSDHAGGLATTFRRVTALIEHSTVRRLILEREFAALPAIGDRLLAAS